MGKHEGRIVEKAAFLEKKRTGVISGTLSAVPNLLIITLNSFWEV